jgi:hypothetical protein
MFNSSTSLQNFPCELLEPINPKNFASKQKWEDKVVGMINDASKKTIGILGDAVQNALAEHWWGKVYDNGVVAPYGLANYLYELYSQQIWIIDILPLIPNYPRPSRPIEEFSESQLAKFRDWLKYDYYAQVMKIGFCDIELIDSRHIAQLRIFGKKRWAQTEKHLESNPNLLKPFH